MGRHNSDGHHQRVRHHYEYAARLTAFGPTAARPPSGIPVALCTLSANLQLRRNGPERWSAAVPTIRVWIG